MRRRILDNLYVGNMEDCKAVTGQEGWSVVHACKHPCHHDKCGNPSSKDDNYLTYKEGSGLFLNMIDPPTPLFQKRMFDEFLDWMRAQWEDGQKILIHCNKGESRAPTLALLFLAKVLYRITATSYDDAWDEFELLIGEKYTPGKGIETWMRDHFHEFKGGRRLASMNIPEAPAKTVEIPVLEGDIGIEMVKANPLIHFAGFTKIENKEHAWVNPIPNVLQFDLAEAYQWCIDNKVPCRIMALKPRQVGCSTFCAQICYHHSRRFPSDVMIMGDVAKRTEKVWSIFQDIPKRDAFGWDSVITVANTEKTKFSYPDGGEGLVEHDTALDPKAGISGTRQVVWLTEAARYRKVNSADKKVVTAVLQSLPNNPNSLCLAESTAEGAVGWFYENWQGAVTLEQRKKGIIGNGWIKVFASWFEFTEHRLDRKSTNAEYFSDDLDHRERRGIDLYSWSAEQIAWRRMKISQDCAGDPRMFDQDFPEDPESCFLASGRPRFDQDGVTALEKVAKVAYDIAEMGVLDRGEGGINFVDRGESENYVWCCERPKPGLSYLGGVDPCMGEQAEGSEFPDAHACGIVRAGYFDEKGIWKNPRLVAAIDVPTGCRWDDEVLAERMKKLLDWYGDCEVIPETGNGLGVINELRRAGCNVYQREKAADNMRVGERLMVIGWETNKNTRPIVINAVANAVRERAIDLTFTPAITELRTFVINSNGRAEAKSGCHDDWVMFLGIVLANIERASMLVPPQVWKSEIPGDPGDVSLRSGISPEALS